MKYTKLLGKVTLTANGLHNSQLEYDRLCLVHDESYRAFVSIKEVPANVSIDNTAYWQPINVISADGEDITLNDELQLKFADKEYNPTVNSGMGYKILRRRKPNTLTQEDINEPNTLYVVQYDFYLNEQTIQMPANSAIYFKGGTINNGTIVGNDTIMYGTILNKGNAQFDGEWVGNDIDLKDVQDDIIDRLEDLENKEGNYQLIVSGGGTYKKGSSAQVKVQWELKQGANKVIPDSITINGVSQNVNNNTITFVDVRTDTAYEIVAIKNGVTIRATVTASFVNPSYFGIVSNDFIATESSIKNNGVEVIKNSKSYITNTFDQNNQKNYYAYPKSFGQLQSITDINSLCLNKSYTHIDVTVNGEAYCVYMLNNATTVNDYKINFN